MWTCFASFSRQAARPASGPRLAERHRVVALRSISAADAFDESSERDAGCFGVDRRVDRPIVMACSDELGNVVDPPSGQASDGRPELMIEHRGRTQLAPSGRVGSDGSVVLNLVHEDGDEHFASGALGRIGVGLGPVTDVLECFAKERGPVAEVVVDERGRRTGCRGHSLDPHAPCASRGDLGDGGVEQRSSSVRHGGSSFA